MSKQKKPVQMFGEPFCEYRVRCVRWMFEHYGEMTLPEIYRIYQARFGTITERTMSRTLLTLRTRGWAEAEEAESGNRYYKASK